MLYQIIGAVVGGAVGYAAYKFIGCSTGACPITSNPYVAIIFGAVLGALIPGGQQTHVLYESRAENALLSSFQAGYGSGVASGAGLGATVVAGAVDSKGWRLITG